MESCNRKKTLWYAKYLAAVLTACVIAFHASGAWAQDEGASESNLEEAAESLQEDIFLAPVIFEGEPIFYVRGTPSLPATERAARVTERIYSVAEQEGIFLYVPKIIENDFGLQLEIDGNPITVVTSADAEIEKMEIGLVAMLQSNALERAITQYKESRTNEAYVNSALGALGLTVAFIGFTGLFLWRRLTLARFVARFVERRAGRLGETTQGVVKARAIGSAVGYLLNIVFWLVFILALYAYISFVLLAFPETRVPGQIILTYVSEPLITVVFAFVQHIPNLIMIFIIYLVAKAAIKGLRLFLDNLEAGSITIDEFEPHWVKPTFFLGRLAIVLVAIVFAYPFIPGSDTAAFKGLTIIAGVVVSFSSNTAIANFISGLIVMYRHSAVVGDRIQVNETTGDVVEIRFMETIIKSTKNELVSVPNSLLLNSTVRNFSKAVDGRGLLVHTTVGIGYEETPKKVIAMLVKAANMTDGLKKAPKPFVLWNALGDYSISYEINAYTSRGASLPEIMSDLHENIVTVFNANGTQIMTPSYIADPDVPKIPMEEWDGQINDPKTAPST